MTLLITLAWQSSYVGLGFNNRHWFGLVQTFIGLNGLKPWFKWFACLGLTLIILLNIVLNILRLILMFEKKSLNFEKLKLRNIKKIKKIIIQVSLICFIIIYLCMYSSFYGWCGLVFFIVLSLQYQSQVKREREREGPAQEGGHL